ncbi:hypothetical protein BDN71DRAFT_1431747 [Pleurotus eryngii]|uniref:Uncharacterized protein n=1 Tax=Pleurotus eryngii TaxID=5323 RepID=A0A9P6D3Q8_PLEER|nr:hypothetical protein BDN71DRAFT_1435031 [Pleurotus eryngii]KAF9494530.1 hypothetical protein BDN71DRAFT_1431747 [Pleurotus eryngii]
MCPSILLADDKKNDEQMGSKDIQTPFTTKPPVTKPPSSKPSPGKKGLCKPWGKSSSSFTTRRLTSTTTSQPQGAEGGNCSGIPPNRTGGPRKTHREKSSLWLAHLISTSAAEHYPASQTVLFDICREAIKLLLSFCHFLTSFTAQVHHGFLPCFNQRHLTDMQRFHTQLYLAGQHGQVGMPLEASKSFEGALRGLNRFLDASIICNDQSIDLGPTGSKHLRRATMEEIIAISKLPEHKAINCLDFPSPLPAGMLLVSDNTLDCRLVNQESGVINTGRNSGDGSE